MAEVTYHAPDGDSEVVRMRGVRFFDGEPVEVTDNDFLTKLASNRHFTVEGFTPAPTNPSARVFVARHVGRGTYGIFMGDEDQRIVSGLTKDGAEAFNALADDDKALRVEEMKASA